MIRAVAMASVVAISSSFFSRLPQLRRPALAGALLPNPAYSVVCLARYPVR
jgi:hypothetical protein